MKSIFKYGFLPVAMVALSLASCNNADFQEIKDVIYIENANGISHIETQLVEGEKQAFLRINSARVVDHDVTVTVKVDEQVLADYNAKYGTGYQLMPAEFYEMEMKAVIEAGKSAAAIEITLKELSAELNKTGLTYVLPLSIDRVENGPAILPTARDYIFAVSPIPYSDVPEFKNYCVGHLILAEDLPVTTMTFEALIMYASNDVSVVQKGHPFTMYNNADGAEPGSVSNGLFSRLGDAGRPGNHINGNIRGRYDFPTETVLSPFKWHHLAYVFDLGSMNFKWYLDGVEVLKKDFTATYGFTINKDKVCLGRDNPELYVANSVPLRYAEVRLWNTLRTGDQLKNNMYGIDPETPGLMGYWKLNEGKGTVLVDSTKKNPDGAIEGTGAENVGVWKLNQRIEIGQGQQ